MYSIRTRSIVAAGAGALSIVQPATSMPLRDEDPQIATRTVVVQESALQGDIQALARLDRALVIAARSACDELYPLALVYLSHQCLSDTLQDARDQLARIRSGQSTSSALPKGQMAVAVRAR